MNFTRIDNYHAKSGSYTICWWYPRPLTYFAYYGNPGISLGMTQDREAAIALCEQHELLHQAVSQRSR